MGGMARSCGVDIPNAEGGHMFPWHSTERHGERQTMRRGQRAFLARLATALLSER